MGTSIDPINQFLYIPVNNTPWKIRPYIQSREVKTFFKDELKKSHNLYLQKCSSCHGKNRNGIRKKYKEMEVENIPSLVGYYAIFNLGEKLSSLEILKNKHKNLKLTSGELANARVADLPTSKVTSGTFADARISSGSVTQHVTAFDPSVLEYNQAILAFKIASANQLA